jgi:hypothetical protein
MPRVVIVGPEAKDIAKAWASSIPTDVEGMDASWRSKTRDMEVLI